MSTSLTTLLHKVSVDGIIAHPLFRPKTSVIVDSSLSLHPISSSSANPVVSTFQISWNEPSHTSSLATTAESPSPPHLPSVSAVAPPTQLSVSQPKQPLQNNSSCQLFAQNPGIAFHQILIQSLAARSVSCWPCQIHLLPPFPLGSPAPAGWLTCHFLKTPRSQWQDICPCRVLYLHNSHFIQLSAQMSPLEEDCPDHPKSHHTPSSFPCLIFWIAVPSSWQIYYPSAYCLSPSLECKLLEDGDSIIHPYLQHLEKWCLWIQ